MTILTSCHIYFDYCCVVWGNCTKTLIEDLHKLQKCAACLFLDVKDTITPGHDLFVELQWMPVPDRIAYHRSLQVYKCLKGQCPSNLQNLFEYNLNVHSHTHSTRSSLNSKLHRPLKYHKSFPYAGAKT